MCLVQFVDQYIYYFLKINIGKNFFMCLDICREETCRRCRCSRDIIWKQPLHVQTKPLIQKQPPKLIWIQVELNILLLTILIKQFISNDKQFFSNWIYGKILGCGSWNWLFPTKVVNEWCLCHVCAGGW